MARVEPGDVKASSAEVRAGAARGLRRDLRRPRSGDRARASRTGSTRASSATSRPTPISRRCSAISSSTRPGRARALLAVEPGADRAGGGGLRLDAPAGRPLRRLERRHPGHRLDQHPGRADLRAREEPPNTRWPAAACRPSAPPLVGLRLGPGAQLGREGGALGGLRPANVRHVATDARLSPCGPTPLRAAIAQDLAAGTAALRRRRHDRHHGDDRHRPGRGRSAGRQGARALAARRCGDGGLGDDPARVPLDVGGHRGGRFAGDSMRTSGSARRSTARSTTSAIPSTWCG